MIRNSYKTISIPYVHVIAVVILCGATSGSMVAATFGLPRFGAINETAAPDPASVGMINTVAAPKVLSVAVAGSSTASAQKAFAFGYLEFDWDPNAPGGVPGFDSWPNQGRRVVDASSAN
jgi:hypothetical protein